MFGYATNETEELMPLPISLAHKLAKRLADVRQAEIVPYLRPDGKTQVTVRYVDGRPVEIEKVLISTQHRDGAESLIKDDLWEHVIEPVLPDELYDARKLHEEPAGEPDRPVRDRRPDGRLRPDRAQDHRRHLRRDGPPRRRRVLRQGPVEGRPLARPTRPATWPRTWSPPGSPTARGPGRLRDRRRPSGVGDGRDVRHREGRAASRILELIDEHFDLRPGAFRQYLRLHRPIYQKTAAYGHFGREDHDFTWERTDKAAALRAAAGLDAAAVEGVALAPPETSGRTRHRGCNVTRWRFHVPRG